MNLNQRTFRVHLFLTESEAMAIAKLGRSELRDLQKQTHYLLHRKLIDLNALPEDKVDFDRLDKSKN